MTKPSSDISKLSFEDALKALEAIVAKLESGKAGLEESIQLYEEGVALRQHCDSKLKDAQLRVEKLTLNTQGQPQTENFKTS